MTEPNLLSDEELEEEARFFAGSGRIALRAARLFAHISALEADNAALLAMLRKWLNAAADAETPDFSDLTEKQRAEFVCYMEAHDVAGRPHPGAALLERLARLEQLARYVADTARPFLSAMAAQALEKP